MKTSAERLFASLAQFISVLLDLTAESNEPLQIPPGVCQLFGIDGVGSFNNWISDKAFDLFAKLD